MKRFLATILAVASFIGLPASAAETSPDELVKSVTNDVLTIVRQDKDIQSGNTSKAVDLVEEKVLPHFNFRRMTILAVGRDWRSATPDQQAMLVDSFKTLLVRTYSNALTQYKNQQIDFKATACGCGRHRCDRAHRGAPTRGDRSADRLQPRQRDGRLEGL